MSSKLFEILTESRIREWEEGKSERSRKPAAEPWQERESYDQQLLGEITNLLERANTLPASDEGRSQDLNRARELEVQLMASLEKRGLMLTAKRISDELGVLRRKETSKSQTS
tara:strand:- start:1347 stop:1685 length:339 start_codon:yes stop_codon:yes gene_type:complete